MGQSEFGRDLKSVKCSLNKIKYMLLEFYGQECEHCEAMMLLVERLKKEEGIDIIQYEVWHDEENAKIMEEHDRGYCGGVPFFINTDNDKFICGEVSYDELKGWALEK